MKIAAHFVFPKKLRAREQRRILVAASFTNHHQTRPRDLGKGGWPSRRRQQMNCSCSTSSPIESCTTIQWPNCPKTHDIFDLVSHDNCCQFVVPEDKANWTLPRIEFDIIKLSANSIVSKDDIVKLEFSKISILSTARNIEWYRVTENGDKQYMETSKASLIEDTGQLKMYLSICEFSPLNSEKRLSCSFIQNETSGEYWVFAILIETRFSKLPSLTYANATCQSTPPESLIPLMALAFGKANSLSQSNDETLLNLTSRFKNIFAGKMPQEGKSVANGSSDTCSGDDGGKDGASDDDAVRSKDEVISALDSIKCTLDVRLGNMERTLGKMDSRIERLEELVSALLVEKKPPGCS